ncbi:MAG: YDG domain-containing protein [Negativicutes bacterium]
MSHSSDRKWLSRQVAIALMAGAVSIVPQVAYGMPQGGQAIVGGATGMDTPSGGTMNIISSAENNVIGWQDFSIQHGEKVQFDNKNYLNLVQGKGSSFIDGDLTAGGGNIYLVNPNGVIFGKGSRVNVGSGNLYVSTQDTAALAAQYENSHSWDGTNPLTAHAGLTDVVNLGGTISANSVTVEGNNIRFTNADHVTVTAAGGINLNTNAAHAADGNGYAHVGYNAAVSDTYNDPTVKTTMAKAAELATAGWKVNGSTIAKENVYMLVDSAVQLQNIKDTPSENYMLGQDIHLSDPFTPIANFTGNFDGNFYTIHDLKAQGTNAGLFADVTGSVASPSRLENVILKNPRVSGSMTGNAGGLVAVATNVRIQNVGITGTGLIQTILPDYNRAGGIVGAASGTTIQRCYNSVQVEGGGIAGTVHQGTVLRDVYNNGRARYGIFVDNGNVTASGSISIQRIYTINQIGTNGAWGSTVNTFVNQANSATWLTVPTPVVGDPVPPAYSAFAAAFGSAISRNGGEQTTWRMHEGAATPVLTAFYRGIVAVKYDYAMGDSSLPGGIHHQGKNWEKPNYHPQEVYNGENLALDNVQYSYGNTGDSAVVTANYGTGGDTGLRNVKRDSAGNAAAYVLFQSGQYDIAGGDFTINKRKLIGSTSGKLEQFEKEYDKTSNAAATGGATELANAHGDTGVVAKDKAHLSVTGNVTGKFYQSKAAYEAAADKTTVEVHNVGKEYYVTLTFDHLSLHDDGSNLAQNYEFEASASGTAESEHGMITPRNITMGLQTETDLNKTYDGTDAVKPAYSGPNNMRVTDTPTKILAGDSVTVNTADVQAKYDNKNASTTANDRKVNYTGMTLSGSDRKNYRLVDENGRVLFYNNDGANNGFGNVENNTSHALVGTGTILRRTIKADGFVMQNGQGQPVTPSKEYDATSAYTLPAGHSIVQNASGDSGVIEADKPYIRFEPGTGAKFLDGSGAETSDASDSGYATAATQASFDITAQATAGEEDRLDNYTYDAAPTVGSASIRTGTGAAKMAGRIEKKNVNAALNKTTGIDKVYDGNANVTLTGNVSVSGLIASDGTSFTQTATYSNQHVRWVNGQPAEKDITYTINLTGNKANNYTLNHTTGVMTTLAAKGTITPKKLIAKFADVTKAYDGTTKVVGENLSTDQYNGNGGVIAGDTVTLTHTDAQYSSKHVKDNRPGTVNNVAYTGLAINNRDYQLVDDSGKATTTGKGNGTITQATVGAGDIVWNWQKDAGQNNVPITKVYDNEASVAGRDANGNTVGVGTYLRSVGVRFGSGSDAVVEDLATSDHSGRYASQNSQNKTAQTVTFKAHYDGPTTAAPDPDADYVVSSTALMAGNYLENNVRTGIITPKTVTVTVANLNPTKTYDGNANVVNGVGTPLTGEGLVHMDGLIAGDGTTNNTTAQYTKNGAADKHVAVDESGTVTQKDVTYTLQTMGGADPSNYQFRYGTTTVQHGEKIIGKGTINKKALTVTFADVSKQYDGKAEVRGIQPTDQAAPTFIGLVTGDGHDDTKIKGVYGQRTGSTFTANANAGTKDVEYTGIADALGENANNYAVQNLTTITHSGGTTVQALFGQGEIQKRTIHSADVQFGLQNGIDKEYDGNAHVLKPRDHVVGGAPYVNIPGAGSSTERLTLDYTIESAEYDNKDVAYSGGVVTTKTVTYTVKLTGDSLNNFTVIGGTPSQFTKTATGTITPRKVVAVAAGTLHKVYDGNVNVPGSGDSVVTFARRPGDTGDALVGGTANTSTAQYVSKNVNRDGAGNVIGQGITFMAAVSDSGNYEIDTSGLVGKTGIISPRGIKAEFKPVTKAYDGNKAVTDPGKGLVDSVANQKISGDDVDLNTDYDAQYRSANVKDNQPGTQDNVVYRHLRLTGGDAGNYQLTDKNGNALAVDPAGYSHTTGNGIITQKVLTGSNLKFFFNPITKEYDAKTTVNHAEAGINRVELDGAPSPLVYTVKSAQYEDKDAGGGKRVDYTIGIDKDNYDISSLTGVDQTNGTFRQSTTGAITPKTVTAVVQENTAITKTYDTTKAVVQAAGDVKKNVTIAGLLSDKDGSGYTVSAEYTDENAGTNKTVNYTVTLTGDSKVNQNYTLRLVDEHGTPIAQLSGQGTINKAVMTANVGKAQRDFDTTATIRKADITGGVTLSGVNGQTLMLSSGALDKLSGQYGKGAADAFTPDPHAGHKAVKYQGMADALQYMADHGTTAEKKIAQNYTIADTLYFAEAADKGEIKPLAIIAGNIQKQQNYAIKEYDGTTSLNGAAFYKDNTQADPRDKGLQFFYTMPDGRVIEIMYEGTGAYTDKNAGKGTRTINYTVTGIKTAFSGDYILDSSAENVIKGNHAVTGNTITPRTIKVKTDTAYDKIYDGTKTVYDANGSQVNNVYYEGLLEADRNQGVKVKTDVMEYASENANADPEGNVSGTNHVKAVVKIENGNGNYTLEDTDDAAAVVTTKTFHVDGKIRQRVVYVDFQTGKGTETANHKTYDGNVGLGHNALDDVEMKGRDDATKTGVIAGDHGNVQLTNATGQYADQNVKRDGNGTPTTKEVYYQNFNLTGSKANNYAVQAAPGKQKDDNKTTLVGRGIINPKLIHAELHHDTGIDKIYDGTTAVTDPHHLKSNLRIQTGDLVGSDTVDSIGLDVERAVYRENPDGTGDEVKDAGKNGGANDALGVDYLLKWTGANGNYELASFSLKGKGKITRRTLHYAGGTPHTEKVYDGTDAVKQADAAKAFANAFNDAVYRKDYTENPNIAATTARYTDGVNASVDNQTEGPVHHQVDYTITLNTNNAYGTSNFQMDASGALSDTQHGTGTITRRTLHMDVPSEMAPNDTAAEPVPTLRPLTGETGLISPDVPPNVHIQWEGGKTWAEIRNTPGVYHYQWIADDGSAAGLYGQNYIFRPGTLTVGVTLPGDYQAALADRDFIPDHLSYQRASRDWDATHFYRMSAIELRHEKKGVNLSRVPDYGPESRIGIPASAQGARSDVSWGLSDLSAYRETEEPSVDLTEAAREAAMALESQDAGVSRIEEKTEPSLRPVASAAASDKAEPTGWLASLPSAAAVSDVPAALGIRINAQDEDVDEAMLVAAEPDRNLRIGIETMGGAVNMMAMR